MTTSNTPGIATSETPFFPCNPGRECLFMVRPNLAASDALNIASRLLATAEDLAHARALSSAENDGNDAGFALSDIISMAKAALDSTIAAVEQHELVRRAES